jgi:PiT family inorganic phosphate transporter
MLEISSLLMLVIAVALAFDFTNGAHDTANAIATVVSTKVLSPAIAVMMAALLNLIGAFIGTHVAQTVGSGIVHPDMIRGCQALTLAGLCGASSGTCSPGTWGCRLRHPTPL